MHGFRPEPNIPKGERAPNYKHGKFTQAHLAKERELILLLRELEQQSFRLGFIPEGTNRWRGRKPRGLRKIQRIEPKE